MRLTGKRWALGFKRYPWAWFELWLEYDYHHYIASITVLTYEVVFEWVWKRKRSIKKGVKQIVWQRV